MWVTETCGFCGYLNPHPLKTEGAAPRSRDPRGDTVLATNSSVGSARGAQIAYPRAMHYVLGFDGGGTKTECVLLDSQRQVRATTRSGPSNPFRIGHEAATAALTEAAQGAAREAGIEIRQITALCAGLAGVGSAQSHEEMQREVVNAFPNTKIRLITDLEFVVCGDRAAGGNRSCSRHGLGGAWPRC